ncbi:MAG: hypothetical protein U9O94_04750, partial [Nanoarchaeota archaeon]|nr:hypothetical protein [Nanoarchaeota archaeon]
DLEGAFNMSSGDKDGFDETFTGYTNISIGTKDLTMCPSTNMYVNNATSNFWNETLLQENISTKTVIFATEVENDRVGFNGKTWDFQMIVADNGDIDAPTTYQFYVELV